MGRRSIELGHLLQMVQKLRAPDDALQVACEDGSHAAEGYAVIHPRSSASMAASMAARAVSAT